VKSSIAAAVAALLLLSCSEATTPKASGSPKPELFLLTALPLVWSEDFGLDQPGSSALQRLEQDYRVTPIDLPSDLPGAALLLAAQPRALPAEELVALDKWVRAGGRVLLLADPMLEWPSELPLGDKRRPPMAFADTGLLQRWGLRLDAPDQRGPIQSTIAGALVLTASPGTLERVAGDCELADAGLVSRCRVGEGQVIVIADADFLNLEKDGVDGPTEGNLPALVSQLASLKR
jgi:hypothetical protein